MEYQEELKKNLKFFRKQIGLTQEEVAIHLHGHKSLVSNYENGHSVPDIYIGNHSSGKMGVALAEVAYSYGAEVVLVNTFNHKAEYRTVNVSSAKEMQEVVAAEKNSSDCIIMAAAVADFCVKNQQVQKIKKEDGVDNITIELVKNPDILAEMCKIKKQTQAIVGFCAESNNLIDYAKNKIQRNLPRLS